MTKYVRLKLTSKELSYAEGIRKMTAILPISSYYLWEEWHVASWNKAGAPWALGAYIPEERYYVETQKNSTTGGLLPSELGIWLKRDYKGTSENLYTAYNWEET